MRQDRVDPNREREDTKELAHTMNKYSQIVIPVLIVMLMVGAFVGSPMEVQSHADQDGQENQKLGPAESLLLTGEEGMLSIRDVDGRIGWGEEPTSRTWSIGAAHITDILKALLDSDRYAEERDNLKDELQEQDAEYRQRYDQLQSDYEGVNEDSPEFAEAQQAFSQLMEEIQKWREGTAKLQNKMQAEQLERAYRDLVAAVDVVSERQGIDVVFRFIPTSEQFETELAEQAVDAIRMRPFLKYPDTIDITDQVFQELSLQRPEE